MAIPKLAALTCLVLVMATPLRAQTVVFGSDKGDAPVMITGGYRIMGQSANRVGTFQERPQDLWRMELNPTLTVYGIPLSGSILLSSEQAGIRQDINAFSLTLDPEALQRIVLTRAYSALTDLYASDDAALLRDLDGLRDSLKIADPAKLEQLEAWQTIQQARELGNLDVSQTGDALRTLGLMSDVEDIVSKLPTIGVGTIFPTFTPLTVSGVRLQGGSIEWNPGGVVFLHAAYGTTQRPLTRLDTIRVDTTLTTSFDNSAFGRNMIAGTVGVGRKEGAHLFVTGVHIIDNLEQSEIPSDSTASITPQKNMVLGLDFRVEPLPGIWTLQGELAGSVTVGDRNAPSFGTPAVPGFLLSAADSSVSSFIDWSLVSSTSINLRESGTRITGSYRRIGAGFRSLAVPNLRTDLLRYDARFDQTLWKRQLSVGLFYRQDADNLIPWKRSTTTITSFGTTVGLNIRRLPFLRLSYAPYVQENDATNPLLQFVNRTSMVMVASGYSYTVDDLQCNTTINGARQWSETKDQRSDFAVTTANVSQLVTFAEPLTLGGGFGYIGQVVPGEPINTIWTVDGSAAYTLWESTTVTGGLSLAFEASRSNRAGFFFSINTPIGEYAVVDFRAERTLFSERVVPNILGGSYNETIIRASISRSW